MFGYLYPGGTCQFGGTGVDNTGRFWGSDCATNAIFNGNVMKKDASFYEGYAKVMWTVNDMFAIGANEFYSPSFLNTGAWGNYASVTGKFTAPGTLFGSSGVGMYISGEYGHQWFGTSDSFYGVAGFAVRHQVCRLQHLEHRRRLHLQGVHARPPLLRHRPVEGELQRLHQRLHRHSERQLLADQPDWRRLEVVRRDLSSSKLSADLTAMTNLK